MARVRYRLHLAALQDPTLASLCAGDDRAHRYGMEPARVIGQLGLGRPIEEFSITFPLRRRPRQTQLGLAYHGLPFHNSAIYTPHNLSATPSCLAMEALTAVQRVLVIPELLDIILSCGDRRLHARCALVNRKWSTVALGLLYREIDGLLHVLRILCPMKKSEPLRHDTEWEFVHSPTATQWSHFMTYARRVRTLQYTGRTRERVADSVFTDLALTRTSHRIFPNLRALYWLCRGPTRKPLQEVCFMHEGVRDLRVEISPEPSVEDLASFAANVTERTPDLTHIYLQPFISVASYYPLLPMLSSLGSLTTITLSRWLLSQSVLVCLSTLPALGCIQFLPDGDAPYSWATNNPSIMADMFSPLSGDAFPSLRDLSICCTISAAQALLYDSSNSAFPHLTQLYIHSIHIEEPSEVQTFLSALAERYPMLDSLALDILVDVVTAKAEHIDPLTFEHLRPLLSLSNLEQLEIRHNLPLIYTAPDLVELGTALPNLFSLTLNCEPLCTDLPPTTMEVLPVIAEHFPNLRVLGLCVDAETVTHNLRTPAPSSRPRFPALEIINFGTSPIAEDVRPIQLYLSYLFANCPAAPLVQSGFTWDDELWIHDDELMTSVAGFCVSWGDVARSLKLLVELRKDESSIRHQLLREVEDLRMRNDVLTSRTKEVVAAEMGRPCMIM
ncbi:hypothetical protein PENSPDRAFT_733667 [Peniophora sp. CONT]|nr:hypothetical protein PENSPDRAFT_733667 [Peniophora sp. CONT]